MIEEHGLKHETIDEKKNEKIKDQKGKKKEKKYKSSEEEGSDSWNSDDYHDILDDFKDDPYIFPSYKR